MRKARPHSSVDSRTAEEGTDGTLQSRVAIRESWRGPRVLGHSGAECGSPDPFGETIGARAFAAEFRKVPSVVMYEAGALDEIVEAAYTRPGLRSPERTPRTKSDGRTQTGNNAGRLPPLRSPARCRWGPSLTLRTMGNATDSSTNVSQRSLMSIKCIECRSQSGGRQQLHRRAGAARRRHGFGETDLPRRLAESTALRRGGAPSLPAPLVEPSRP